MPHDTRRHPRNPADLRLGQFAGQGGPKFRRLTPRARGLGLSRERPAKLVGSSGLLIDPAPGRPVHRLARVSAARTANLGTTIGGYRLGNRFKQGDDAELRIRML